MGSTCNGLKVSRSVCDDEGEKRLQELVERGNMGSHYLVWGREFWVWTSQTGLLGECRNQRGLKGQVGFNVWAKKL